VHGIAAGNIQGFGSSETAAPQFVAVEERGDDGEGAGAEGIAVAQCMREGDKDGPRDYRKDNHEEGDTRRYPFGATAEYLLASFTGAGNYQAEEKEYRKDEGEHQGKDGEGHGGHVGILSFAALEVIPGNGIGIGIAVKIGGDVDTLPPEGNSDSSCLVG